MSDETERPGADTRVRGEAAWKAAKDGVANRNAEARKEGGRQRQEQEDKKAAARRAAELRERAELAKGTP
jgi:hypothetical protein